MAKKRTLTHSQTKKTQNKTPPSDHQSNPEQTPDSQTDVLSIEPELQSDRALPQTLYLIATPLGNNRDITLRALDILSTVDAIACENLQRAKKLLHSHTLTPKQLFVCQSSNEEASAIGIIGLLQKKQSIAYISDAGTPCISDPGTKLLNKVREAGFAIESLPGPCAFTLLASLSGFPCRPLCFVGFLSPKATKRNRELNYWLEQDCAFVIYESPYRIIKTIEQIDLLDAERQIFLGREMTKKNAQFYRGSSDYVLNQLRKMPLIRGEFSLLVSTKKC